VSEIVSPGFCVWLPWRGMGAAPSRAGKPRRFEGKTPLKSSKNIRKRRGFPAPRWRGAHSVSRQLCAKAKRHGLRHALCRRSHMFRTRRASRKRACAASSRDGVKGTFLTGLHIHMCTGTHLTSPFHQIKFSQKNTTWKLRSLNWKTQTQKRKN